MRLASFEFKKTRVREEEEWEAETGVRKFSQMKISKVMKSFWIVGKEIRDSMPPHLWISFLSIEVLRRGSWRRRQAALFITNFIRTVDILQVTTTTLAVTMFGQFQYIYFQLHFFLGHLSILQWSWYCIHPLEVLFLLNYSHEVRNDQKLKPKLLYKGKRKVSFSRPCYITAWVLAFYHCDTIEISAFAYVVKISSTCTFCCINCTCISQAFYIVNYYFCIYIWWLLNRLPRNTKLL